MKQKASGLDLIIVSTFTAYNTRLNDGEQNFVYQKLQMAQRKYFLQLFNIYLHNATKYATLKRGFIYTTHAHVYENVCSSLLHLFQAFS